ncbi:ARM repeat-containing protein [Lophiostoma macrostomum CBS 122681]|uniref:ARM repeat-containing protein n=1 Tax=Lophiostoma macrostomum CBS 122681 TaxID=1314788 RepID=A0A6A6TA72_9PLEO|nr:ARM repeat-containing protein [Lophiostoma macrostomum CBS 122681]
MAFINPPLPALATQCIPHPPTHAMATTTETERAAELAQQARQSVKTGNLSDAARFLREATTIAPDHPEVKAGWVALKEEEARSPLIAICEDWINDHDEATGDKALRLVKGQTLSNKNAQEAFEILMAFKGEDDILDEVTGELLNNPGAQTVMAQAIQDHPTQTYYEFFERGDDSIGGLLRVLLNRSVWPSDEAFVQAHRDCFMLSLAMMMEEALDHPERAMKGVANLLAAHAEHLKGIIDADSFDVILESLDIRNPRDLRGHATLATVKLLELAPETAQKLISNFITYRVQKSTADRLIVAFSAAAAIFPINVSSAAALFLTDGFVSTLAPMVLMKKSQKLEQAALELINAACVDKTCRDSINRHCRQWLEDTVGSCTDKHRANIAAVILVKLGEEPPPTDGPQIIVPGHVDQDDLVSRFKSMILSPDATLKQDSVEGLAFASLRPIVREELANDPRFLKHLVELLKSSLSDKNTLYGGLTIFTNLTTYLPIQSEDEKRMAQLKAYAETRKPSDPNPLQDEAHVTARCKRVLDAGIVPLLIASSKKASPSVITHTLSILLSLSQSKSNRGILAQQGAVKLLIQLWDHISSSSTASSTATPFPPTALPTAAHALSRILISTNPSHIFTSSLPAPSAIRPLTTLLRPTDSSTWQLHAFESLLALTNLASLDPDTATFIITSCFDTVNDDLVLSPNTLVRRAAMELLCNLMAAPAGIEKFADGSKRATQRLHILLAMTDVDDVATRSAAGGALAMLVSCDEGVDAVLGNERGVEFLLGLCRDESEDVRHRGVVCIRSVIAAEGVIGERGVQAVKQKGGVETLKGLLKESRRQEVLALGVETLKILLGQV